MFSSHFLAHCGWSRQPVIKETWSRKVVQIFHRGRHAIPRAVYKSSSTVRVTQTSKKKNMFGLGKVHHVTCKKAETIFVEARQGWTGSPTRNKSIRRRNFASPVASETSSVCGTSRQCAVHFEYRVCIPIYGRPVERYKIRLLYKCFRKDVRRPGSCSSRLL